MTTKKRWTKEEIEFLKENYPKYGNRHCAKKLNRTISSINLKSFELKLKKIRGNIWTKKEDSILKKEYPKQDIKKLSILLNRSIKAIYLRAHFLKLKRDYKIQHNENFFNNINLKSAFWAGWLAGDGYLRVSKEGYKTVSLFLKKDDVIIIKKIKKDIEFTGNIFERTITKKNKTYFSSGISIGHAYQWQKDLIKYYNITPRKSLTLQPPNSKYIYGDLALAYICGIYEADGNVFNNIKSKKSYVTSFVGTKEVLLWIRNKLSKINPKCKNFKISKLKNIYRYRICGKNAIQVFKKLKSLNVYSLNRKWDWLKEFE